MEQLQASMTQKKWKVSQMQTGQVIWKLENQPVGTYLHSLGVPLAGAAKLKSPWPCPLLKPNMSVQHEQHRKPSTFAPSYLNLISHPHLPPSFDVTTKVPYLSQSPLSLTPDSNISTSDTTSYNPPSQMVTSKWNGSPPWIKWPTS